jgi:hypothetical protein
MINLQVFLFYGYLQGQKKTLQDIKLVMNSQLKTQNSKLTTQNLLHKQNQPLQIMSFWVVNIGWVVGSLL